MARVTQDHAPEPKTVVVTFRLSASEAEKVTRAAKARGLATGAYARGAVLEHATGKASTEVAIAERREAVSPLVEPLREATTALNRVGVNVNTLARWSNTNKALVLGVGSPAAGSVPKNIVMQLAEVKQCLDDVQRSLGAVLH